MIEDKQLIKYKKGFFRRIKEAFFNIFHKKNAINDLKEEIEKPKVESKKDFMDIYNKVKNGQMDIDLLDEENQERIMIMINEEIDLTNRKIYEVLKQTENMLDEYEKQNNT